MVLMYIFVDLGDIPGVRHQKPQRPNLGGPMVTGGGLVFVGAAMDNYIRALDMDSGTELWKRRLPAGGQATPMTYRLAPTSRKWS